MPTFDQTHWKTTSPFPGLYNRVGYVATTCRAVQPADALAGQHRWLWRVITRECVKLHTHVMAWYDGHVKLPILQVGASPSLAGAKDAIQPDGNLQNRGREHNALNPLMAVRHLPTGLNPDPANSPAAYLNSDVSFFSLRASTIGAVNRSLLTHLGDGNADFDRLKPLQKTSREQEKRRETTEANPNHGRLLPVTATTARPTRCPFMSRV